tara:strand:- start:1255 stop:2028 length:774 start_codon:yes stop_codon:yes gene_type:complete
VINLSNFNILLILLFISSCTVTTNEEVKVRKKVTSNKDEGYFKKAKINISDVEDYEIELSVSEKFNIDNDINGNNVSHKLLPIPSVVKVSNPNNLDNFIIARNVKLDNDHRFSVSSQIVNKLDVKSNIYIEYLKKESIILRTVEDSKEESKIKMDSTLISTEVLEDDQTGLSSKLDYNKIESLEAKKESYRSMLLVDTFDDIISAKLGTNKIKNLGLVIEEIDNKILVFAGPFKNNDINLKLDFLIKNGYLNAQTYP